ncbi:hypothetical protein CW304_26945 [Bacillus sp. UFRGS-B20]|nr:hypothetical protein CW304_26945 [Bacillus sp. UFRGS-B20]
MQGRHPLNTKYFNAILIDGDWQNDWITHIQKAMRDMVRENWASKWERLRGVGYMMWEAFQKWKRSLSKIFQCIQ